MKVFVRVFVITHNTTPMTCQHYTTQCSSTKNALHNGYSNGKICGGMPMCKILQLLLLVIQVNEKYFRLRMGTNRDGVKRKGDKIGMGLQWSYCMCIMMRWPQNLSASLAEKFWTSALLCTYKQCDHYSPIPILSPFLSLYVTILKLQDFLFILYTKHCAL